VVQLRLHKLDPGPDEADRWVVLPRLGGRIASLKGQGWMQRRPWPKDRCTLGDGGGQYLGGGVRGGEQHRGEPRVDIERVVSVVCMLELNEWLMFSWQKSRAGKSDRHALPTTGACVPVQSHAQLVRED